VNGRFAPGLKVRRAVLPSIATGLARNAGAARRPGGEPLLKGLEIEREDVALRVVQAAFPSRTAKTAGAAAASPSRSARISVNASAPAITAARTRIRTSTSGSTPFPCCRGSLRSEKQEMIAALSNPAMPHPSSSENSAFIRRPTASNQRIPTDSDLQPFVTRCFARLPWSIASPLLRLAPLSHMNPALKNRPAI